MISSLASFLKGVTGKVLLGVVLVATMAGAAAAAGAPVPVVGQSEEDDTTSDDLTVPEDDEGDEDVDGTESDDSSVEGEQGEEGEEVSEDDNHGAVVSTFAHETELEGCERGQAVAGVARGDLDPESDSFDDDLAALVAERCGDDDASEEGEEVSEDDNHGAVVSTFAHETELEGCERGQAVAGVARGDLDPESDSFDDDLAALVAERCGDDEDVSDEGEDTEDASDEGEDTEGDEDLEGPSESDASASHAPGGSGSAPGKSGSAPGHNK